MEGRKEALPDSLRHEHQEGPLTKLISMVIVSKFELEWNSCKGVFCPEYGEELLPLVPGSL